MSENTSGPDLVFMIASDKFGQGADKLGALLLHGAVKTLGRLSPLPDTLLFLNSGVRVCCEDSPLLKDLATLAAAGTRILCCGTCLDFYNLKESLVVGQVSNMHEILSVAAAADRLVRI